MSKSAPLSHRLLLLAGTCLLMAACVETTARILAPADRLEFVGDDETLWEYKPNQSGWLEVAGKRSPLAHIDALGLRRTFDRPADERRQRVLALGDSFTFGAGVADDETFSAQLEKLDDALTVFNAGVGGWGVFQSQIRMERLLKTLEPHLIILTVLETDVFRQPFATEEAKARFVRKAKIRHAMRDVSRAGTILWRQLERLKLVLANQTVPNAMAQKSTRNTVRQVGPSATYRHCWEEDRKRILDMHAEAQRLGVEFAVVGWPQGTENTSYFRDELAALENHGISVVDLSEALAKHPLETLVIPNDGHPTPHGHRVAAEEIHRALRKAGSDR